MNKDDLQKKLCQQFCADVELVEREDGILMISTPFSYPDGDYYSVYLKEIGMGKFRISDGANTMMRLSYDTPDVEKYFTGNRGNLMGQILRENRIKEDNGNFYVDISVDEISKGLFRLGQALSQIYDLSYLNRDRPASTFYKDLENLLNQIVNEYSIALKKNYVVPGLQHGDNYLVDYSLQQKEKEPLFLFGIPSTDKAKLVTITLQYFLLNNNKMPTLLVFENQEKLPSRHLSRLMDANVGGSQVSSIDSRDPIEQNIARYVIH